MDGVSRAPHLAEEVSGMVGEGAGPVVGVPAPGVVGPDGRTVVRRFGGTVEVLLGPGGRWLGDRLPGQLPGPEAALGSRPI